MKLLATTVILIWTLNSFGQIIITEGPSISSSAVTVPKNYFQIETSFGFRGNNADPNFSSFNLNLPSALLRYGVSEKLEFRVFGTQNMRHNTTGVNTYRISNVGLGVKYSLLNLPERKTQMAIIGDINVFNQDSPFFGGTITYALSHSFNERHSIGFNVGLQHDMMKTFGTYVGVTSIKPSLIYNFKVEDQLTIFTEIFSTSSNWISKSLGIVQESLPFRTSFGFDIGFMYLVRDNIQLDFSAGAALNFNSYFTSVGFNILLNTKK